MANWNWGVVNRFVWERCGISLSRSSCLNWLHRLGFAFKRPKQRLLKADEAKREAFVVEYAALMEEASQSNAKIFFAAVGPIGPDPLQPGEAAQQPAQHQLGAVPVLYVGRMHRHCQQQALGIHHYVALAPFHLLACVVTPGPPFSAVFTDWLSMIAALGLARRPSD